MAIVNKPNVFSSNTTISSSEVNSNFDTIYNEFNGSISSANLADDAVTAAKLADNAVVTANITNDSVTATKIDWASTGADGGIWWEELGRTTLSVAGDTVSVASFPARKYLKIMVLLMPTGGTIVAALRFNSDTGNNYTQRYADNDSADGATTSATSFNIDVGSETTNIWSTTEVINISAQEKLCITSSTCAKATGAGTAPIRRQTIGKWANTSAQITTVTITNGGTGDYAIGSEVVVLGHN